MTKTANDLVRDTWALVSGDLQGVGEAFYKNLFDAAPALQTTVFAGTNLKTQQLRLMSMVDAAVKLLDSPDKLVPVLLEAGERHAGYGTLPEHYPAVGTVLIATLRQKLGNKLTPEAEAAWGAVYGVIQAKMIEGANSEKGRELAKRYAARKTSAPHGKKTDNDLVRDTWALVSGDLQGVGEAFYKNLFEAAPALKTSVFAGTNLAAQPLRLMSMVDAAVKLLEDLDKLVPVLLEAGERHAGYGTLPEHYPAVGNVLIATLRQKLGNKFTPEAEAAWGKIYGVIQAKMIEGANSEKGRELAKRYAARKTATKGPNDLVRDSWALISGDLPAVGEAFYGNLFKTAPALKSTVFAGVNLKAQQVRLMSMVDAAVKLLDTPEKLVPVLIDAGERHVAYGTLPEHYPVVGAVLIATLREKLGSAFTPDVEAAWGAVYGVIQAKMIEGASSARGQDLARRYAARVAGAAAPKRVDTVTGAVVVGLWAVAHVYLFALARSK